MSSNFLSHLSWREQCKVLVDFISKHKLVDDVATLRAHVEQNRLEQLLRATLAAEGVRVKLFDVASVAGMNVL
jgi:hypothetical protein